MTEALARSSALHACAMPDLSLDDLAMFVRVLERGGFSSAARSLGVPISNVSRAVARLDAQSGVQFLVGDAFASMRPVAERSARRRAAR